MRSNLTPLTTTDATATTLATIGPTSGSGNSVAAFDLVVTAQAANGDSAVYFVRAGVRFVGGAVALVGTPSITSLEDAGASAWSVTMDVDGNAARVRVSGAAVWRCDYARPSYGRRGAEVHW